MDELFGIPLGTLVVVLAASLAVAFGAIAALGLRRRVLVRLGVRNLRRRRGRSALIVVGLMLATTIMSAALVTGDTMSHTIRATAVEAMGETDEVVAVRGAFEDIPGDLGEATGVGYFDAAAVEPVEQALEPTGLVDGVTAAIIETVALQAPSSRQNEPGVTLFAADPARMDGFSPILLDGEEVSLGDLRDGEVFLNERAAEELRVGAGDRVLLFAAAEAAPLRVRGVVRFDGSGTADASALLPLEDAQRMFGQRGKAKFLLVSNRGSGLAGAELSDQVMAALKPVLPPLGLEADAMKRDAIDTANEAGTAFMAFFTTFGSFSIAAGILLVFLVFVLLAAERRGELGIARAVGTRRSHLVQMFVHEGAAYDLIAALVGSLLGAVVAFAMVKMMAQALGAEDEDAGMQVEYAVTLRSLVVAFALGALLTLVVVAVSAWRVSVMTIATAIRNLPEPLAPRRRRRLVLALIGLTIGLLLAFSGASGGTATPLMLGVSLAIASLVPLLRLAGVPERLAFTACGLALVIVLLLPWSAWESVFGELSMNFSTWVAAGLMLVVGAVWTIVFNADLLLAGVVRVFARLRGLAPILRMSIAYPLSSRFRTGTTLAMFTLVVFTLVTGTISTGSFTAAFDDTEVYGGGFHVRAGTSAAAPVDDMAGAVARTPDLRPGEFTAVGSQSVLAVDMQQRDSGLDPESYVVRGLDDGFLEQTTFPMGALGRGYSSTEEVWAAVRETPRLAVVDPFVAPRRDQFGFVISETDFRLTGFFYEDGVFDPFPLELRDPQTGRTLEVTVIGILADTAPWEMLGVSTTQETLAAAFPGRVRPTIHYFALTPEADPEAAAARLESTFLANGMEAQAIEVVAREATQASRTMNRLVLGFMGLGLVVGVAALGVISARSVVERRQQIGVLRAVGFRRGMVQAVFLVESSFIALTAIVVGTALGLVLGYDIVHDSQKQPSWSNLTLVVPWTELAVIFAIVYAVALLATLAPAVRASRITPAEALRYQ